MIHWRVLPTTLSQNSIHLLRVNMVYLNLTLMRVLPWYTTYTKQRKLQESCFDLWECPSGIKYCPQRYAGLTRSPVCPLQANKARMEVSQLWCGPGNIHGSILDGQSFWPGLATAQTLNEHPPFPVRGKPRANLIIVVCVGGGTSPCYYHCFQRTLGIKCKGALSTAECWTLVRNKCVLITVSMF